MEKLNFESIYPKGFVKGDFLTAEQLNPSRYLNVTNNGRTFTVTCGACGSERRERTIKNGSLKHGSLIKGELSFSDITKTFQCNIPPSLTV